MLACDLLRRVVLGVDPGIKADGGGAPYLGVFVVGVRLVIDEPHLLMGLVHH